MRQLSKQAPTPASQLARDEARRLAVECVHVFLETGDDAKARAALEKARLCIIDAQSAEKAARAKRLN